MINATQKVALHQWWGLLARGILAILFGIIALAVPGIALLVFIYVFAAYALLDGIMAIVVSVQERRFLRAWWVLLLEGVLGIIFGILAFTWPGETALVLLFLVGAAVEVGIDCDAGQLAVRVEEPPDIGPPVVIPVVGLDAEGRERP